MHESHVSATGGASGSRQGSQPRLPVVVDPTGELVRVLFKCLPSHSPVESGPYTRLAGRRVASTLAKLIALIVSASSGSGPATSNNSAFSQHSYDSLEGRLGSWTASLSGFVCQTLFPRTHFL